MTKSTISAACASVLIINEENKKLLLIAQKLQDQGKIDDSIKISELVIEASNNIERLVDFLNKKSLTVA